MSSRNQVQERTVAGMHPTLDLPVRYSPFFTIPRPTHIGIAMEHGVKNIASRGLHQVLK